MTTTLVSNVSQRATDTEPDYWLDELDAIVNEEDEMGEPPALFDAKTEPARHTLDALHDTLPGTQLPPPDPSREQALLTFLETVRRVFADGHGRSMSVSLHDVPLRPRDTSERLSVPPDERGSRRRSRALAFLAAVAVLAAVHAMRSVFIPLTFAVMLFFLLRGPVRRLVSWHVPRLVASALVLVVSIGTLGLATVELAAPASAWAQRLPEAVQVLEAKSRTLRIPLEQVSRGVQLVRRIADANVADKVPRVAVVRPGALQGVVEGAAELTSQVALTIVCAFFLLLDGDGLLERINRLAPAFTGSRRASTLVGQVGRRMSQYLLAVTSINLGLGALVALSFFLLGMPNPLLWGGLAAVLTYVPYLGPAIGLTLVVLASFVTFPTGSAAVLPPLAYFALASLEGNVVTPLVLGHSFRISPLVVFVWLSLWVWLWSIPGAILAVPMLMLIKIVCQENLGLAGLGYLLGGEPKGLNRA